MQPFRQTGLTVAVPAGTPNTAITQQSSVVLVTNINATTWGYFSAMVGADDGTAWPPVITAGPPASTTKPIPAALLGVPIPPGRQVLVAIPGTADHYAAQTTELYVTPVELLKSQ